MRSLYQVSKHKFTKEMKKLGWSLLRIMKAGFLKAFKSTKSTDNCDIFLKSNLNDNVGSIIDKNGTINLTGANIYVGILLKNATPQKAPKSKQSTPNNREGGTNIISQDTSTPDGTQDSLHIANSCSPPKSRESFRRLLASADADSSKFAPAFGAEPMLKLFAEGAKVLSDIQEWTGQRKIKTEGDVAGDMIQGSVPISFMKKAIARSRAVGLLKFELSVGGGTANIFRSTDGSEYAILTNHHVLNSTKLTLKPYLRLGYSEEGSEEIVDLGLDRIIASDETLDFTLMSIKTEHKRSLDEREYFEPFQFSEIPERLIRFQGTNLISHPAGRPTAFSIRGLNYLENLNDTTIRLSDLPEVMRHGAYTLCGSSGALVCNDDWRPFALHFGKGDVLLCNNKPQKVDPAVASGKSDYVHGIDNPDCQLFVSNEATSMYRIYQFIKEIVSGW